MKQLIKKYVSYHLGWGGDEVSIAQIRKDLDTIEALGATHIKFNIDSTWGSYSLEIEPIKEVLETDEEYQKRLDEISVEKERRRNVELQELERLKKKYNQ
jgi:hypothetical protein